MPLPMTDANPKRIKSLFLIRISDEKLVQKQYDTAQHNTTQTHHETRQSKQMQ